jgi:hypothetical protein
MQTLSIEAPADQACLWLAGMSHMIDGLYVDMRNAKADTDYALRLAERIQVAEAARDALREQTHGNRRRVAA